ncbi:MAG TPA: tRNA (guanosine(37)-N1)-methyltransferase TrmD [Candidatus Saccharicenans sp.]|jgi:tRNA (guanine37-N1)-methyltransferase|nr:tRNA (guanosine(37)-N1)-methyltransferase TrmD [Candidatus Saccharicenans sp.]HOJ26801.1 tRNA (guanosine(37)-N1)-methyltransferase TrmD [Candidatus Saccharicenans sp.]HOL46120.1 tRNA (guanosine(37)-N1)-methyltransferase TrmD [Candidatus Saccharicenans sp.]HPP24710.1 tRNA (guanosine(37)-N1)-methyltransferase TrmD [Candidatus Saccharicenans sp.]
MRFDIITIFPGILESVFSAGIIKKAQDKGMIDIKVHDLRDYTADKHRQVDDRPYGGLEGMVFKPEPVFRAVESLKQADKSSRVLLLTPQGKLFNSALAEELAGYDQVILICGRYEGVDERVSDYLVDEEISIGDYVLSGGELAAAVVVEAVSRFVPGVVGREESVRHDSFATGLLDFPQYTRPRDYRGYKVPSVLFSGDHQKIARWRLKKSLEKTLAKRPDMLKSRKLSAEEEKLLSEILEERKES